MAALRHIKVCLDLALANSKTDAAKATQVSV